MLFLKLMGRIKLYKIIKVSHVVAHSIAFILFYDQIGQGGVFKFTKNERVL